MGLDEVLELHRRGPEYESAGRRRERGEGAEWPTIVPRDPDEARGARWAAARSRSRSVGRCLAATRAGASRPPRRRPRTFDLGGGVTAALGNDGSFSIADGRRDARPGHRAGDAPLRAHERSRRPRRLARPDPGRTPTSRRCPSIATTVTAEAVDDGSDDQGRPPGRARAARRHGAPLAGARGRRRLLHGPRRAVRARLGERARDADVPHPRQPAGSRTPTRRTSRSRSSSRRSGWGVFVASREAGAFDVASTDPPIDEGRPSRGARSTSWFFVDPDPLAIVARFNRLAGPPAPAAALGAVAHPLAALGERRRRASRSRPSTASATSRRAPCGSTTAGRPPRTPSPSRRPSSATSQTMMAQLAALGFRVMAWTSPYLEQPHGAPTDEAQQLYQQGGAGRHFFVAGRRAATSTSRPPAPIKGGAGRSSRLHQRRRRSAFWEGLVARATRADIHGFKCDYGEDFIPNLLGAALPRRVLRRDDRPHRRRLYPDRGHATYHAVLDAAFPGDGAAHRARLVVGRRDAGRRDLARRPRPRLRAPGRPAAGERGAASPWAACRRSSSTRRRWRPAASRRSARTPRATAASRRASRRCAGWSTRR